MLADPCMRSREHLLCAMSMRVDCYHHIQITIRFGDVKYASAPLLSRTRALAVFKSCAAT